MEEIKENIYEDDGKDSSNQNNSKEKNNYVPNHKVTAKFKQLDQPPKIKNSSHDVSIKSMKKKKKSSFSIIESLITSQLESILPDDPILTIDSYEMKMNRNDIT